MPRLRKKWRASSDVCVACRAALTLAAPARKAASASAPAPAWPLWRRRAPSTSTPFMPAWRNSACSASRRRTTSRCSSATGTLPARRWCARRPSIARGVIPSIDGIIAVRGGYGSVQLLPLLDPDLPRRHPKVFIGYSDITTLHIWLGQQGQVAFQGPMLEGTAGARSGSLRSRHVPARGYAAEPSWRAARPTARDDRARRSGRPDLWRHAHADCGIARHSLRVRPAAGLRAVSRGRGRAPIPSRSPADAAAAGGRSFPAPPPSCWARSPAATSQAATPRRGRRSRRSWREFPGPVVFGPAGRPRGRSRVDAAARRADARDRRRPARASSSKRPAVA